MRDNENENLDKALKDIELDEILNSMKNNGDRLNFLLNDEPFELPSIDIEEKVEAKEETIIKEEPKPDKAPKLKKEKKKRIKKYSESKTSVFFSKIKNLSKKQKMIFFVPLIIIIVVIVAVGVHNYQSTAYLKPYEEKYGVEYPKGISEDFCDAYGADQQLEGRLYFADLDKKVNVYSASDVLKTHFDEGSNAQADQQFKAISLSKATADIEPIYSSAESYVNQSQKISFTDIYGKTTNYQVISCYYVTTNPADDNGYLFPYNIYGDLTEDSFNQYEDRVTSRSLYFSGYDMKYTDDFLTLSVDSDFMTNFRFVVVAVKVENEVTPITETTENTKIHYPQIWYDENDEHNPYWLASEWQPVIYTDTEHTVTQKIY